jgi:Domain of unknown function (DUF4404)
MPDTPETKPPSVAEIRTRLHEVARMVRQSRTIAPESQRVLAELVDELGAALQGTDVPPEEVARLAESTAHVADSLHQQHDEGLLARARDRLEESVLRAEASSPVAVGLARRLLDMLANIGI